MKKCPKCHDMLEEKLTRAGVLVDICSGCAGYWLDRGELNFFCKSRKLLFDYDKKGLLSKVITDKNCPKCEGVKLHQGSLPSFTSIVEECSRCKGLFFDQEELVKLNHSKYMKGLLKATYKEKSYVPVKLSNLSPLGLSSLLTMTLMYSVLFGFVVFLVELGYLRSNHGISILVLFVFIQFLFGPIILDLSLRLFGSLSWAKLNELPPQFAKDLVDLCKENNLLIPKVGIIEDGSPQAYTYGRTPKDARVVFSRGMFEILNEEELKAVLAHELGHIKHWDFVIMSLAQLVPIILYHVYRILSETKSYQKNKNGNGYTLVVAFVAYAFYFISEYIVLFISRLREYHADYFSVKATKNPNALLTALTKIGLGLAVTTGVKEDNEAKNKLERQKAIQSMGIMNIAGSKSLLLANGNDKIDEFGGESLKEIMKWDFWNPWAAYYELHSTHPLLSKRIIALADQAVRMGQEPFVTFDLKKTESSWDDFFIDLIIFSLPYTLGITWVLVFLLMKDFNFSGEIIPMLKFLLTGFGIGGILRLEFIYPSGRFLHSSVVGVLKKIRVSPVRSYPVKLKGTIIGRGDSGNIFSEDLVLKDETGIIFLDHEPFGFNLFFALKKFDDFQGEEVVVEGWYRRSPIPFIEVKKITSNDDRSESYTKRYKEILYLLLIIGSYLILNGINP